EKYMKKDEHGLIFRRVYNALPFAKQSLKKLSEILYIRIILNYARVIDRAQDLFCKAQGKSRPGKPLPSSWIKINMDGSVHRQHKARTGGIIRDENGKWMGAFNKKLG
ncbi:hypothetical protein Ancab_038159, partial [Ancistrocladus abbreviatus]